MTFVRTRQSLIAWMLYGFILFSGLACSISHGQMLGTFNQWVSGLDCGDARDISTAQGMDMSPMFDHLLVMKLAMADCAFAGSLALGLILFAGSGWVARAGRSRLPRSDYVLRKPPRRCLPELSPQAP